MAMKISETSQPAMMAETAAAPASFKRSRWPQTVIARFVARRTTRGAAFWAVAFGAVVASKAAGFATAYPTARERATLAKTFSNNIGINALLGRPHDVTNVGGFTAWNTLGVMAIIGAVWAFLLATKTFRGDEAAGRWELLMSGQTTGRRAAVNALAGLGASLAVLYAVSAAAFIIIGRNHSVGFGTGAALFFALAAAAGAAQFMAIGALASQLMPTRSRAAGLSAVVFGACFLVRAMADTTSASWLLNVTPLGWIEKLRPLSHAQPVWLLPILGMVLVLSGLTVWLAGQRDLGDSIFSDKDSARSRTGLLGSPLGAAIRLTRMTSLGWLMAIGLSAGFYGLLTKPAAQAFGDSLNSQHIISRIAHAQQAVGAAAFLGVVFFLQMTLIMSYAASAVGRMREDEAEGYLDNLLVRPVSRTRWLGGRVLLVAIVVFLAGLVASTGIGLGMAGQDLGITAHSLLLAGFNAMVPAALTLGSAVFALGFVPRLTTLVGYGIIAWSFLIEMVSSGINLNHWVLDTSVLHHVALAPATSPDWGSNLILVIIGLVLGIAGALRFNGRDLQGE